MNAHLILRVGLSALVLLALGACSGDMGGEEARNDGPGVAGSDARGTGWAVVVGVSLYDHFPSVDGATMRAERMRRVFQDTWGIPEDNTRLLLNESATRDAIRESLVEWLPGRASEGDEIVVFLSGHGSTVRDASGDEADGLDEAFCPADAVADGSGRDILDDSLSTWLERLPTERVTLIMEGQRFGQGDFDAGESGSGSAADSMTSPPQGGAAEARCGSGAPGAP